MSAIDEKRALAIRQDNESRVFSDAPEVVVTDGFHTQPGQGPLPDDAELGASEQVPPAYSEHHDQLSLHQAGFNAGAAITGAFL